MGNQLRTREPTGAVAWPFLLVEGSEKAGKTYAALSLSADDRIGRSFLFDFGEGSGDEYAPLGDYEIVEHDGTYRDFLAQLVAACAVPTVDGKPNLIVIDSVTAMWEALKVWAENRAKSSRRGKQLLADDPDAEIDVPMNIWTDTNDRWGRMVNMLRGWPGIAVVIARGREVAKVGQGGQPVAGQTEYRVEAQKSLPYAVSAQVRMQAPHKATLVAARSLHVDIPARGLPLPDETPLAHLVFDVLGAGKSWSVAPVVHPNFTETLITEAQADRVRAACTSDELRAMWRERFGCVPAQLPADRWDEAEDWLSDLEAAS